jgi:hypothetical protein
MSMGSTMPRMIVSAFILKRLYERGAGYPIQLSPDVVSTVGSTTSAARRCRAWLPEVQETISNTMPQFLDHLTDDVLPVVLDRLSSGSKAQQLSTSKVSE